MMNSMEKQLSTTASKTADISGRNGGGEHVDRTEIMTLRKPMESRNILRTVAPTLELGSVRQWKVDIFNVLVFRSEVKTFKGMSIICAPLVSSGVLADFADPLLTLVAKDSSPVRIVSVLETLIASCVMDSSLSAFRSSR
jgi:hypothetical protein